MIRGSVQRRGPADNRGMSRKYFAALLLAFCAFFDAAAETVMVSIGGGGDGGDKTVRYSLSALEDGIMEAFFLADHIVFNDTGFRPVSDRLPAIRRGREGGASLVLLVDAFFGTAPGEGETLPERLAYTYVTTAEQRLVASGEVKPEDGERSRNMSLEAYYAKLGERIARQVLSARRE